MPTFNIATDVQVQYSNNSGTTWTSIESDTFEITIERGIQVESGVFARPNVGTATVSLMKSSLADFVGTPGYKTGSWFQIITSGGTLFFGKISNIGMQYEVASKQLRVDIQAEDYMKVFMNTLISTLVISGTLANRSFDNVMSSLNSTVQAIDSNIGLVHQGTAASTTYQSAYTYPPVLAGEILVKLLDAELGWCWADRQSGACIYMNKLDIDALQTGSWNSAGDIISNVHSSSTKHHCMNNLELAYETNAMANDVKVTETDSLITKTATNATSITNYGRTANQFEITMDPGGSPSYTRVQDWATRVANAADPKYFKSVTIPAVRRDGTLDSLVSADVGEIRQIEFASTGLTTLQERYLCSTVRHHITTEHWEIQFGLWRGI